MTSYHVTVTRQDGAWFADVNGLAPNLIGVTDVPRFADLDVEVRDLVAGLTDGDPEGFDLSWRIMFGDTDVTTLVAELEHVDTTLDVLEAQRDAIRTELIKAGIASKLSQAAIADVLRVSQQRVGQLANAS
ncbi:MAG: MerR [Pseudonocardiaceae bacterium]